MRRASSAISGPAPTAPPPTMMSGAFASAIIRAAVAMASGSATGGGRGVPTSGVSTRLFCPKTSHGASTATGPGRPDIMRENSSAITALAAAGWSIRSAARVRPRSVAIWSGNSCSWPRPCPIRCDMMLPVMQKTGALPA